jgi:hypothetical protein
MKLGDCDESQLRTTLNPICSENVTGSGIVRGLQVFAQLQLGGSQASRRKGLPLKVLRAAAI